MLMNKTDKASCGENSNWQESRGNKMSLQKLWQVKCYNRLVLSKQVTACIACLSHAWSNGSVLVQSTVEKHVINMALLLLLHLIEKSFYQLNHMLSENTNLNFNCFDSAGIFYIYFSEENCHYKDNLLSLLRHMARYLMDAASTFKIWNERNKPEQLACRQKISYLQSQETWPV